MDTSCREFQVLHIISPLPRHAAPCRATDTMEQPARPVDSGHLHYLPAGQPDTETILPAPPLPGSAEQAADMDEVVAVHHACTSNEAAIAVSEKKFSVFNFSRAIEPFFQAGKLPKTEAFFQNVQKETEAITDTAKEHWRRPRPYTLDPSLASGKLEKGFGYPSGHSTEATVLALVLSEIFPDKRDDFLAISRDIGWHRVEIARHYPTDIYAGRVFAKAIVREMQTSPAFKHDLEEARTEIQAAQRGLLAKP
jgi:acid phosphatase (class A)